ncbi:hypothetical protein ABGV42_23685 [Paenibacillus pabuli]|uniref:hypothetical protein n=1 Tax=Paenibacillus pabuli TaxID=1472 RepID=UPI003242B201
MALIENVFSCNASEGLSPSIASILSIGGGGIFAYLIMLLMLSGDGGFLIFDVPPASQTLVYLSLTLLPFVVAVYILHKRKQRVLIGTIIVSFIASIIIPNQSAILDFFKTPSKHVQSEIRSQVQRIIDQQHLSYVIDQKESKSWTNDEVIRTVVYLRKIKEGDIEKKEVKPFVNTTFEMDVKLVFNDQFMVNYVTVVIDKGKEVDCTNESYCK